MADQSYNNNNTFTCPAGVIQVLVEVWGSGGGGGGSNGVDGAAGGGGGAYAKGTFTVIPSHTYIVTVGAVGAGGNNGNSTSGGVGGTSMFNNNVSDGGGTLVGANGGGGTSGTGNITPGGGGALNVTGGLTSFKGGGGAANTTTSGGGGGAGSSNTTTGASAIGTAGGIGAGSGGTGGAGAATKTSGNPGSTYGGGGGGAGNSGSGALNRLGGAGALGEVLITYTIVNANATLTGQATAIAANTISASAPLGMQTKVGSFTMAAGSNVITGVGFTPEALILWGNEHTGDGTSTTGADNPLTILGMGVSSSSYAALYSNDDFSGGDPQPPDGTHIFVNKNAAGTSQGSATLTSLDANGFTLNFDAGGSNAHIVNYMAIGGTDLTNVAIKSFTSPGATGNQPQTGVGFKPDAMILIGGVNLGSGIGTAGFGFITATGAVATSSNFDSAAGYYQRIDRAYVEVDNATIRLEATLTTFDSDGFTLNFGTVSAGAVTTRSTFYALCLKGGSYAAGALASRTTTGTVATTTGFKPTGLLTSSVQHVTSSSVVNDGTITWEIGGASGTSARSVVLFFGGTVAVSALDRTKVFVSYTNAATPVLQAAADLSSFDTNGFTLNFTTADATAREIIYFALGPNTSTPDGSATLTGVGLLASRGTLTPSVSAIVTGVGSAIVGGTLTATNAESATLSNASLATARGTLGAAASVSLTGIGQALTGGTVTTATAESATLTGVALVTSANTSPAMALPGIWVRALSVDHSKVPSDQTNFTVLVSLTDTTLKSVAITGGHVQNANGYDIVFTSDPAGTSLLKWEVESYDSINGTLVAWLYLTSISSTADTVFYMRYGDSTISTFQGGATGTAWDSDYLAVYHLNGSSPSVASSTGANDGTNHGATAATGQIDGGANFSYVGSQYIDCGTGMNPTAITLSAWVNATSFHNTYEAIVGRDAGGLNYSIMLVKSTGKLACFSGTVPSSQSSYDGTGSHTLTTGSWYYLTMTYNSVAGLIGYVNASQDGTSAATGTLAITAARTDIGQDAANGSRFWDGLIDEVRVSDIARSADWITTEYNNQLNPGTFIKVGGEEAVLPGLALTATAGTLTATIAVSASLTGVALAVASHNPSTTTEEDASLVGSSLTSVSHNPTATGAANASLSTQGLTAGLGTLTTADSAILSGGPLTVVGGALNGSASASLTGSALTAARGTLTTATAESAVLTGIGLTATSNTISATSAESATLTGQALVAATHAPTTATAESVTLNGSASAVVAHSLTATGYGNAALTGQAATVSLGAVTGAFLGTGGSATLTGVALAASPAALAASVSTTAIGAALNTAAGIPSASGAATVTLSGQLLVCTENSPSAISIAYAILTPGFSTTFSDDFNRALLGPNWIATPASAPNVAVLVSGYLTTQANGQYVWYYVDPSQIGHAVYARATIAGDVTTRDTSNAGLSLNNSGLGSVEFDVWTGGDGNGHWLLVWNNGPDYAFYLNSFSISLGFPMQVGDTMELQLDSGNIIAKYNGVVLATWADASGLPPGQPGIAMAAPVGIDDFEAVAITSGMSISQGSIVGMIPRRRQVVIA